MRTTQYIGLTSQAIKWVMLALSTEDYNMTSGMFDEKIIGKIYNMSVPKGPNSKLIAKEELQASPWSSGPMLFTHLHLILIKENGQEVDMGLVFSWVLDPSLSGTGQEYDPISGHYYV